MAPTRYVTEQQIKYMTMAEYAEFRSGSPNIAVVRDYEFCRRMYIETGSQYWLTEMIERVSPWETGG